MTEKELLYVEDAIGHEKNITNIVSSIIENLEDEKLIQYMKGELKNHEKATKDLIKLLEDECDE